MTSKQTKHLGKTVSSEVAEYASGVTCDRLKAGSVRMAGVEFGQNHPGTPKGCCLKVFQLYTRTFKENTRLVVLDKNVSV